MEENILCILVHFLKFENGNSNRNVTCPNDTYCTTWWKHMMKSSAAGVTSSQLTDSLHSLMENVITDSPCPGADGNELSRTHLWIWRLQEKMCMISLLCLKHKQRTSHRDFPPNHTSFTPFCQYTFFVRAYKSAM